MLDLKVVKEATMTSSVPKFNNILSLVRLPFDLRLSYFDFLLYLIGND